MILYLNVQSNIQYIRINQIIVVQTRAVYTLVIPNRKIMLNANDTTKIRKVIQIHYITVIILGERSTYLE